MKKQNSSQHTTKGGIDMMAFIISLIEERVSQYVKEEFLGPRWWSWCGDKIDCICDLLNGKEAKFKVFRIYKTDQEPPITVILTASICTSKVLFNWVIEK